MKNCQHYLSIHKKVERALWGDLNSSLRDTIAKDDMHETEAYKWFTNKVNLDATRLFEDAAHWMNQSHEWPALGQLS